MNNPWSSIEKPSADFNVRQVDERHPLNLFWGLDSRGRYLFVVETPIGAVPSKNSWPELAGIKIGTSQSGSIGRLVLLLSENTNWELFLSLCNDLCRASASATEQSLAVSIIIRRLQRWQELLKRQKQKALSTSEIKGLVGELLFLVDPLASRFGWDSAVSFWKGPENAPQDFAVHDVAVEVKCQSGSSKPTVKITSADQLIPQLSRGYLHVFTIASADPDSSDAFTLNELTARIRNSLASASNEARERFENLLFSAGYFESEYYDSLVFQRVAERSFELREGFPRLLKKGIPEGIDQISYQLHLDACSDFETTIKFSQ